MDSILCDSEPTNWQLKRKKKENAIKMKKVRGENHINHVGKSVPERQTGRPCKCKNECFSKTNEELRNHIVNQFNSFPDKNAQDSHIAGLITVNSIERRRSRKTNQSSDDDELPVRSHKAAFTYKVRNKDEEIKVCLLAFLSLHGIKRARVRRIQEKLIESGKAPVDMRGKHTDNRYRKTPLEIIYLIETHIKSFKARQSHYSRRKNPDRLYLPETLNVKTMHVMFLDLYKINVSYQVYWEVFNKKFNIKFGLPRSDTCSYCDTMQNKIAACTDESFKKRLELEHDLHKSKAEYFYALKRLYKNKAQQGEIKCLSFDYMQNLPLPHIKTSDTFYSRQLWYFVFGIHDLGKNLVHMNVYDEMIGHKGQNDVTSMLLKYFAEIGTEHETCVLFSDGCSGQNKNYVMVRFLYYIVVHIKLFKKIIYIFPIRGHSYLPNDQDFSLVEAQKRKFSAEIQEDWDNLIINARTKPSPFELVKITLPDLMDIGKALNPYFLKQSRPPMKIKTIRMLKITQSSSKDVFVKDNWNGNWISICIRNNKKIPEVVEFEPSNTEPIPLKAGKLKDIQKLAHFLKEPKNTAYYLGLQGQNPTASLDTGSQGQNPTASLDTGLEGQNPPASSDMDEDDNSSGDEVL